ncbi:MAG: PilN domain-containing protein [Rugosibacter sp.]|nr:PilN domain-containing protein [Rugosibacter sp.]
MSSQINLYHPRFLKVRDWLNLGNLALAVALMTAVLGAWTLFARTEANQRLAEAASVSAELDAAKAAIEETNQKASQPANPQLLAEVAQAQAALAQRGEIARLLESGAVGNSSGFSAFLRGFARQAPPGLWLTGFKLGAGGSDMEIRGSTHDERIVPEYIRRLGAEKMFQGRQFSALSLQREVATGAVTSAVEDATAGDAVSPAPGSAPGHPLQPVRRQPVNFILTPATVEEKK